MGGSGADTPTPSKPLPAIGDGFRASDAEREQVAARLRDEFVAGRLSHETFLLRMNAVLEARRQSDLSPLLADLPPRKPREGRQSAARSLLRRIRGAWTRRRGLASAARPGSAPGAAVPARGVTIGMQTGGAGSRPMLLRFPRSADGDCADGEFSIGRDVNCDLAIADMTVSRRHATLERTPEGWLLTDLESTNGTRVNGWRVRGKTQVRAGDLVTFGNAEAVLLREDKDEATETDLAAALDRAIGLMSYARYP